MTSDAILERLLELHPKLIDLSLDRTVDLLDRLGNPQDRLPPVVHLAGTNGKGSTQAILRSIAEAAGYKVHAYTSPHLARFHERIRLAGDLITEPDLVALLEHCEQVNEGRPITFFEITTCAAFKAMAETPADLVLLETGMGGRLDSTNVVERPAATAITPISLDHMQFLGPTIASIAGEKAAIQKAGTPSVIAPQAPEAMTVIEAVAEAVGAPLVKAGTDYTISAEPSGLHFQWCDQSLALPRPGLSGAHQVENAGTALALAMTLREAGFDLPDDALAEGVRTAFWPARLQMLQTGPLIDALPGWDVLLDGGHNAAAGAVIADALAERRAGAPDQPIHAVCGMLNTKEAQDFLAPLAPHLASFTAIEIPGETNTIPAGDLAAAARAAGVADVRVADTVGAAADDALGQSKHGLFLVCGSLYLAGYLLRSHS